MAPAPIFNLILQVLRSDRILSVMVLNPDADLEGYDELEGAMAEERARDAEVLQRLRQTERAQAYNDQVAGSGPGR